MPTSKQETCHSKICIGCKTDKPLSQYYKRTGIGDGYRNKCKRCSSIEDNSRRRKKRAPVQPRKENKYGQTYRKAKAYSWVITRGAHNYADIVHEAWLAHLKYEGTDLFEQNIYSVLMWVKNVWYRISNQRGRYMRDGVYYTRQFLDVDDFNLRSSFLPPDVELISKEFYTNLFKQVDNYNSGWASSIDVDVLRCVLDYFDQGYKPREIAKEMNMSEARISYYRKKLKRIINGMQVNNPFAGNRARPIETVSLKTYDKKYKNDYVCDFERPWCDKNETAMLVVHREREEYILVKLDKD